MTGEQAGPAGAASAEPRNQEGLSEGQYSASSSAGSTGKGRSDNVPSNPAKRIRENSMEKFGTAQGAAGHSGKPSGKVYPIQRGEPPKHSSEAGKVTREQEAEVRDQRTTAWVWSQASVREPSQSSVVFLGYGVESSGQRSYWSRRIGRFRREEGTGYRGWTKPRAKSRTEGSHPSSKTPKKKDQGRR